MMRLVVAMISSRVSKRGKCGQESNGRNIPLHQIPHWTHFVRIRCNDWNHINILLSWNIFFLFYISELSINCIMNHVHMCYGFENSALKVCGAELYLVLRQFGHCQCMHASSEVVGWLTPYAAVQAWGQRVVNSIDD